MIRPRLRCLVFAVMLFAAACNSANVVQMPSVDPLPPRNSGKQIAVVASGGVLSLLDMNTGVLRTLASDVSGWPAWSPDGERLAYSAKCGENRCLYVMNTSGDVIRLNNHGRDDGGPLWSPDGTQLLFGSSKEAFQFMCFWGCSGPNDLYVVNDDGSHRTRLGPSGNAAWSPDGKQIAFIPRGEGENRVYVMNADGFGVTALKTTSAYHGDPPTWSPDGSQIAFTDIALGGGSGGIYVINTDSTNLRQLSTGTDYSPAWSPDGTRIAYNGIYLARADGSSTAYLGDDLTGSSEPKWSADSAMIAYRSASRSSPDDLFYDSIRLCVMEADGSGKFCLDPEPISGLAHFVFYAWRP